ncbi:MAG: hypothetical protein HZA32_14135 [Opitutae bacterium]|nr:hypothetical protein [Opitutae bacterium]
MLNNTVRQNQHVLIKNYGRLWKRSAVEWRGGRLRRGALLGIGEKNKSGGDFRDQIAIYILHDAAFVPIYVGQTGSKEARLFDRLAAHNRNPKMGQWDFFSWFGFREMDQNGFLVAHTESTALSRAQALDEIESLLILLLEPKRNRQTGRWKSVEEFFQMASKEAWGYSNNDIHKRLVRIEELLQKKGRTSRNGKA